MRHRSPPGTRPPRWTRAQLYSAAGLGFGLLCGTSVLAAQSLTQSRAVHAALWLAIGALLVVGGWLFGRHEDGLRLLSVTDPLTGLTNRREFERRLQEELARSVRHGLPLSLLILDLDLLKEINDSGGHRAGDRALVAVAEALRGSCRAVDIPARIGGDEFAILAPATSARDAQQLAARVQANLKSIVSVSHAPVSISIGIADLVSAGMLGAEGDLLEAADRALYRAKSGGRDRVALCGGDEGEGRTVERPAAPALRVMPGGRS
jgi:diguanylate cyclase (GGDEF)-like protein